MMTSLTKPNAVVTVELGPCPLCGRVMLAGASVDAHHFTPKSRGGRAKAFIHRICHRKIHSLFTEQQLARHYNTPEALLENAEIARFVTWVRSKPPEFYDGSVAAKSKRR